ncbi:hypothetical protein [Microbacterium sp. PAMC21962]|jgi:hypothetical protein|uniref:hypothetical protein n=1 Tax=Microbacterium sp. PAMC21962 TaxID=2861280 RepID=UPI001C6337C9|nr:hypothetical protein [Microbacterium sp. PAMC21962]QYF97105.1 hypothetical protein KY498_13205 [Microbacterium sp. PAMC21962]
MSDHAQEREAIQREADTLLARDVSQSRPTVADLCIAAGYPRWKLTHRHVDLKDNFLSDVTRKWGARADLSPQAKELERLREQNTGLRDELGVAETTIRIYAEALEELRLQLAAARQHPAESCVIDIASARAKGRSE